MFRWCDYKPVFTVVDLCVEGNACFDAVREATLAHGNAIAAATQQYVGNEHVRDATASDGYSYGYGYGSDSGDGYGYGDGYSYGDGYGYGDKN
jgi:hypothetical protein